MSTGVGPFSTFCVSGGSGAQAALEHGLAPTRWAHRGAAAFASPSTPRHPAARLRPRRQSEVYVHFGGLVDLAAERQRLAKEIARTADTVAFTRQARAARLHAACAAGVRCR